MKLIALILGLGLEHLATHLLHLRELHWFDAYFDFDHIFKSNGSTELAIGRNAGKADASVAVGCHNA